MVQQVLENPHHVRERDMFLRINTLLEKAVFTHRFGSAICTRHELIRATSQLFILVN